MFFIVFHDPLFSKLSLFSTFSLFSTPFLVFHSLHGFPWSQFFHSFSFSMFSLFFHALSFPLFFHAPPGFPNPSLLPPLFLKSRPCRSQHSQIGSARIYFILILCLEFPPWNSHPRFLTLPNRYSQSKASFFFFFFPGNSWEQSQSCSFFPLFPHSGSSDSSFHPPSNSQFGWRGIGSSNPGRRIRRNSRSNPTIPAIFPGNCCAHSHGMKPFQGKQEIRPLPILRSGFSCGSAFPGFGLEPLCFPREGNIPKGSSVRFSRSVFHGSRPPPCPSRPFPRHSHPLGAAGRSGISSQNPWMQGIALGSFSRAFPWGGIPIALQLPWIHEENRG